MCVCINVAELQTSERKHDPTNNKHQHTDFLSNIWSDSHDTKKPNPEENTIHFVYHLERVSATRIE